jgi:hypothetical protein
LPELALSGLTTPESLLVQKLKSLLQQHRPGPDIWVYIYTAASFPDLWVSKMD